jgi:peptide/nickel transport system substrate-binding protein
MIKNIRKNLWFISAFTAKYKYLIITGVVLSVVLGLILTKIQKILPGLSNKDVHIGLVGQHSVTNLPIQITQFLNAGLTTQGKQQTTILNLAETQDIDDSDKSYTYKLKPGLTWSDGTIIKAQDINISIPKVAIETPDEQTIKFILPAKFAPFPSILNFPITNQKGLLPSPFDIKLKQKSSGVLTQVIVNNGTYKTFFSIYPTASQALTAYKLGQIDAIVDLPLANLSSDFAGFGITNQFQNKQKLVLLVINHQDSSLSSKSVRQGLAYSLDLNYTQTKKALTIINPDSWVYNPLVKEYLPNSKKAGELISNELELELSTTPELLSVAEQIKNSITIPNLKLNIKVVSSTPENFQLLLTTFNIPQDPDQYPFWHSTQPGNVGGSTSEKLDKLLEDGRTNLDHNTRKTTYHEFQRVFAEELPAIVLFHPQSVNLSRNQQISDIINTYWSN